MIRTRRGLRFALAMSVALAAEWSVAAGPPQPDLPAFRDLGDGIRLSEVTLPATAPGQAMKVWIYLPAGDAAAKSLPCVFVAPAGSNLISGMALNDGDRAEHLPYVKSGFAVVAYELDGPLVAESEAAILASIRQFMAARGGVDNARRAIAYTLAKCPAVDPNRLYTAGHSSAATLALDVAAADARIKACCAYAAIADVRARLTPEAVKQIDGIVTNFETFVNTISPLRRVTDLKQKPVLLFSALDDTNARPQQIKTLADALKAAGNSRTELITVPSGGHYESMINDGIPAGIAFLKKLGANAKP